jgi:hypothetical protein
MRPYLLNRWPSLPSVPSRWSLRCPVPVARICTPRGSLDPYPIPVSDNSDPGLVLPDLDSRHSEDNGREPAIYRTLDTVGCFHARPVSCPRGLCSDCVHGNRDGSQNIILGAREKMYPLSLSLSLSLSRSFVRSFVHIFSIVLVVGRTSRVLFSK